MNTLNISVDRSMKYFDEIFSKNQFYLQGYRTLIKSGAIPVRSYAVVMLPIC